MVRVNQIYLIFNSAKFLVDISEEEYYNKQLVLSARKQTQTV